MRTIFAAGKVLSLHWIVFFSEGKLFQSNNDPLCHLDESVAVAHSYSAVVYARTCVTHSPLGGSYENGL